MEGAAEGQDLNFILVPLRPSITAGELERPLVGVRAGEAEVDLVREAGLAQELGQPGVGLGVVEVAHV